MRLDTKNRSDGSTFSEECGQAYQNIKRLLDLAVSIIGLTISAPFFLLVAIAIKLDSPGPVLFRQRRIGFNGQEFLMYKFRSMENNADSKFHQEAFEKYANGNYVNEDEHVRRPKDFRDPRVTRIGNFLRRSNLDELPQLINVIKGEMSIVGPRPAISYELQWYDESHHRRFDILPGITGLWQITDRLKIGMKEMIELDLEYRRTRNLLLDLRIEVLTGVMILREFVGIVRGKRSK